MLLSRSYSEKIAIVKSFMKSSECDYESRDVGGVSEEGQGVGTKLIARCESCLVLMAMDRVDR